MPNKIAAVVSLLIVDDDPESMERLRKELVQPRIEIMTASSPETGLAIVSRSCPHIVLITPQPGGSEMLKRLRTENSTIHAIRLSAHYDAPDALDNRDNPVSLPELRKRIRRLAREVRRRK